MTTEIETPIQKSMRLLADESVIFSGPAARDLIHELLLEVEARDAVMAESLAHMPMDAKAMEYAANDLRRLIEEKRDWMREEHKRDKERTADERKAAKAQAERVRREIAGDPREQA